MVQSKYLGYMGLNKNISISSVSFYFFKAACNTFKITHVARILFPLDSML